MLTLTKLYVLFELILATFFMSLFYLDVYLTPEKKAVQVPY